MNRGRGGGGRDNNNNNNSNNNFFGFGGGDPFGGFGHDPFGNFGGFGGQQRSLVSSMFGGRDPFDDPFFSRPFGGASLFGGGPNMFGGPMPSMFGGPSLFGESPATGFIDNRGHPSQGNSSRGPVIEEILSDDEGEGGENGGDEKKENTRKHSRSSGEVYVEEPDDGGGVEERRIRHMQNRNEFNRMNNGTQPQTRSFSFHSSKVTYGGPNGAYYTSSTTRNIGDNGVMIEEKKEADTTTGKAEHKVSKGIRDKGHTVTRKLNPDGKVDIMQTLHNLDEDELAGFQETWKGNARKNLPGWTEGNDVYENIGPSSSRPQGQASRHGWALPSVEQPSAPNRTASRNAKPPEGQA